LYKIPAKTLFTGQKLIYVPECHSTNSSLAELLEHTDLPEGTVLITDHQTRGRGQRGNTWESGKGENLTFSILLHPRFLAVRDQFRLSMAVAIGIAEGLAGIVTSGILLKWPNDILMGGKKVGGVLIENQSQGAQLSVAIVGIGINVNARELPHPGAGALIQAVGRESDLNDVFQLVVGAIEARYLQLRSGGHAVIERDYLGRLYRLDVPQEFEADGAVFTGTIIGVDDSGRIRIQVGEEERRYSLKEVKFRFEDSGG
jgi:BirA family biotin operon repressor/biotin-[acetyl-CoA-carboxylase] ligase